MATGEQLLVVSTVDKLQVGDEFSSWSEVPHLTLFPPMTIRPEQWPAFDVRMQQVLTYTLPRFLVGGQSDDFGTPDSPKPVRKLDGIDLDLRMDIENIAIDLGAQYDPTFGALETEPHISDIPRYSLAQGELFDLDEMVVVSKEHEASMKVVKAIYRWKVKPSWRAHMRTLVEGSQRETAA